MNLAAVLVLFTALNAAPYVRSRVKTATTNDPRAHCLWWKAGEIVYRQNANGNAETRNETEFDAVTQSFNTWNQVFAECASLSFREGPRSSDRTVGHDFDHPDSNQNGVMFRTQACTAKVGASDGCWAAETCANLYDCWEYSVETIGLTTTTYDKGTGQIYDADVELNAVNYIFTTVDSPKCVKPFWSQSCVATDVQNTVTHEVGHVLGLSHTTDPTSVMYSQALAGEISKRLVDPGSKQGICSIYPKGGASRDCVINPPAAALGPVTGCTVANEGPLLALALLALTAARPRRR